MNLATLGGGYPGPVPGPTVRLPDGEGGVVGVFPHELAGPICHSLWLTTGCVRTAAAVGS